MSFDVRTSSLGLEQLPLPHDLPTDDFAQFPFLRLPYDLRRMIYIQHLESDRTPDPEYVHMCNLPLKWKDVPSPLLGTCQQIREEVMDLLRRKRIFTVRVTTFGVAFDMLSLSCLIAHGLPKSYVGLTGLQIEIWPPHAHDTRSRIEMLYLHEHLRKLRDELRAGPQIPLIKICFQENPRAKWIDRDSGERQGQPRQELMPHDRCKRDNMQIVLDLFACITNVDEVAIQLPPTLHWHHRTINYAGLVKRRMEKGFLENDLDICKEKDKSLLDNPFYVDVECLQAALLNVMTMYPDPINYKLLYYAWYGGPYSDPSNEFYLRPTWYSVPRSELKGYSHIFDFEYAKIPKHVYRM